MNQGEIDPEILPEERLSEAEREKKEETLWEGNDIVIKLPDRAAIPKEEGTHMQVIPKEKAEADWRTSALEDILKEGYYALAAARIIADSGRTEDNWVNIHWNSRPEFMAGANVFGRNPTSETGWAKSVVMREGGVEVSENREVRENLRRFTERYLSNWEKPKGNISLFSEGINELKPDSPEFQAEAKKFAEREDPWQETTLWTNEKFVLVAVDNPHLNGVHLVVHPREAFWKEKSSFRKPWQAAQAWHEGDSDYVKGFLESVAILKTAQEILTQHSDKVKFANPEIHYSGNWGKDLLTKEKGGKFDMGEWVQAVAEGDPRIREEKRRYQYGKPEEFGASMHGPGSSMHGHLYASRKENEYVELPSRPKKEVPEEWEGIQPMDRDEIETILQLIQNNMTNQLENNAKGGLK